MKCDYCDNEAEYKIDFPKGTTSLPASSGIKELCGTHAGPAVTKAIDKYKVIEYYNVEKKESKTKILKAKAANVEDFANLTIYGRPILEGLRVDYDRILRRLMEYPQPIQGNNNERNNQERRDGGDGAGVREGGEREIRRDRFFTWEEHYIAG